MLRLFKGTCEAVRAMHDYRAPIGSKSDPFTSRENQSSSSAARRPSGSGRNSLDEDAEMFPHPEGDGDGDGYSYHGNGNTSSVPLMTKHRPLDEGEAIFDGDEELSRMQQNGTSQNEQSNETELVPYAHRDLKPG